ncbi:formyltetrahydrofolate deformylase [Sphingosinicella rhizophila]|uniref:Formyltetrahydrofolate deformylase n=1 Tax=Sphingosinicella rhizophila TaxID=3050082 RepID=A0ABU3Q9Z0_9SPHN|nr:formyltetrahydrofolate deformylase [Sphingosinicella sp. GR2756]MDT9600225.1 formyltetrahydrofolate deformylase [Sphingosinicella sp. GR2756]
MTTTPQYLLTLRCPDRKGIVATVTTLLADQDLLIVESHQFEDHNSGMFFMRVLFAPESCAPIDLDRLRDLFRPIAERFDMDWAFRDVAVKPRVLLAVSRFGHCLYDLLHRWRSGHLPVEIVGVVSNHDDMRSFTEWNNLPYHHLPIAKGEKAAQEARIMALVDELDVDLVVLARYMQILSPELCAFLDKRCINIHHSFLPSFKGAKPYHQAHARGVKVIGATAHYVTTDLDEGPIIEQDTKRVTHSRSADELVAIGQEVECAVLARAVRWHVEGRVMLNGDRTIVFD